ncbi:hypothetical protein ELH48_01480 [Rhizobium ruizarguesonis]|uniref:hypothetical protein n=1 Tax=Rhizobium ruizarguesonis TaxID=2081791 RepID=UPI0004825BA6|nr:hypothetical protein [Rhizobium ruizarguesonis]MBY5830023.1 hypothetical protein [Rhizobium leguminosarum]QJS26047.1 hypothetical protein RLTA1_01455 [Rhizobium leguminosarum bv. trifolii TA1]MBY5858635.1 hypothetical protein [Rhizobium leguminosarum]MBY5873547.1 hypothetical protein [Rhizobium leguminosarum]NEH61599.1 hypothetical protein [Rhizobium ruizarguesonis]
MAETRSLLEDLPKAGSDQHLASNVAAGHLALVPTWLPLDVASGPSSNSAGSGGDGISEGVISSNALAVFMPSNAAIAGPHSGADAFQGNDALINQHPTEMAGIGGNGGSGNVAVGSGDGANHAGTGGSGLFYGGLVSTEVALFAPVNTAVAAGPGAEAHAEQSNNALFLQGATQIGGMGGSGGDHNVASHGPSMSPGTALTLTGDFYAGHGGDGYFVGTMVDVSIAIFSPINIAIGAAGGSAEAHQTNNVIFDQGAVQIAGIGGNGGGFNLSSDTIFTGNHALGGGGDGVGSSTGSMVDVNFGYFHPINIAVPAGGTADAQQVDHVLYDQHALQLAGIAGHGGEGNLTDAHSALVDDILSFMHG